MDDRIIALSAKADRYSDAICRLEQVSMRRNLRDVYYTLIDTRINYLIALVNMYRGTVRNMLRDIE